MRSARLTLPYLGRPGGHVRGAGTRSGGAARGGRARRARAAGGRAAAAGAAGGRAREPGARAAAVRARRRRPVRRLPGPPARWPSVYQTTACKQTLQQHILCSLRQCVLSACCEGLPVTSCSVLLPAHVDRALFSTCLVPSGPHAPHGRFCHLQPCNLALHASVSQLRRRAFRWPHLSYMPRQPQLAALHAGAQLAAQAQRVRARHVRKHGVCKHGMRASPASASMACTQAQQAQARLMAQGCILTLHPAQAARALCVLPAGRAAGRGRGRHADARPACAPGAAPWRPPLRGQCPPSQGPFSPLQNGPPAAECR